MRKVLPMVAVLAVTAAAVVPAPAQFSLSSLTGGSTKTPTTATPTTPATTSLLNNTTNISRMLPTYNLTNLNQSVLRTGPNPRQFNFASMLPNFSFINKTLTAKGAQLPSLSNATKLNQK
jgi:hypothetical protein